MEFQHFIITRFNLKNKDWKIDKNNQEILNEEWLEFRYDLFLKSCFNSIKNQSNLNFKWLVYFDVDTPEKYKKLNKELTNKFPQFKPLYKSSNSVFLQDLPKDIHQFKSNQTISHFITTRIDNDDAFHFRAIETIQNNFNYQNRVILNLSWIYCYNVVKKEITRHHFLSNPFISLVEPYNENFDRATIFSRSHNDWRKDTEILKIESEEVFCLQMIHERNVLNKMEGVYVKNNRLVKDFNLLLTINHDKLYFLKVFFSNIKILLNRRKTQIKNKVRKIFNK